MSTRHVVEHALRDYGYSPDVVPQIVNNLLNEHAHDLAERIRTRADEFARDNDFAMEACVLADEWDRAADTIDPEVTS